MPMGDDNDRDPTWVGVFALVQVAGQLAFAVALVGAIASLCGLGAAYTFFSTLATSLFGP